ncbi:hypothetical protein EVAR_10803_1 [Eumeta japonica]|uniref:Uncharacterized protein n=1 Tax=Eumeta variegata TaxID=151549 RepID=A0A4C1Y7Y5_EUMVA|nr:hypothetical protein EVAR_10803_1 [Eumeta japonica]
MRLHRAPADAYDAFCGPVVLPCALLHEKENIKLSLLLRQFDKSIGVRLTEATVNTMRYSLVSLRRAPVDPALKGIRGVCSLEISVEFVVANIHKTIIEK